MSLAENPWETPPEPPETGDQLSDQPVEQTVGRLCMMFGKFEPKTQAATGLIDLGEDLPSLPNVESPPFRYPDITFKFDDHRIRGTPLIPAPNTARIRGIVRAVQEVSQEYVTLRAQQEVDKEDAPLTPEAAFHEEYAGLTTEVLSYATEGIRKYLGGKMTLKRKDIRRLDMVPVAEALNVIETELRSQNHPIAQVIGQFMLEFSDLPHANLAAVREEFLLATQAERVRKLYDEAAAKIREASKDNKA